MSTSATVTTGPITLTIPAVPAMVRVARLTASSVATLADASIDEIDDIKIAVSEVVTLLIQQGDGNGVTLEFRAGEGDFVIDGSAIAATLPLVDDDIALSAAVLDAVSRRSELTTNDGRISVHVTMAAASESTSG